MMPSEFSAPQSPVTIREAARLQAGEIDDLSQVLVACVNEGASLGFHAPLSRETAQLWWAGLPSPGVTLLVAEADGRIGGTVQLHAATSANGAHRVEIAKLLVHPTWRRRGIASALMNAAEDVARQQGKLLIVLDTREGDPSNLLYASVGYTQGGRIPDWARDASGEFSATVFWYKRLAT
jgi:GNAT superfamily N-acetyltransferase